ncbi:4Fe-4S binding protein [Nannocystis sp.]|uniref:NADH-quinone oxidoreductase subunit B family protein n=1 Tax=Nannocystis sp. TaxID=1962667 RepID=UPI0025F0BFDB|nr:4Fe-4S binding protein [Nannocystis sp.]
MLHSIRVRRSQGWQFIPDVRAASPKGFRGLPHVAEAPCREGCSACRDLCPTSAIALDPFRLDLGLCVFCGECADVCPDKKLSFSNDFKMASTSRETLVRRDGDRALTPLLLASATFKKLFGPLAPAAPGLRRRLQRLRARAERQRQRQLRHGPLGHRLVASPRHAGRPRPLRTDHRQHGRGLRLAWDGMPAPKLVIAAGSCAISGAPYQDAYAVDRSFLGEFTPQLYIPGCPPHPLTFVNGLLDLLGVGR